MAVTVVAAAVAVHFATRYGDRYVMGDTQHRRDSTRDALRVAVPGLVAAVAALGAGISLLLPRGLGHEWRREVSELRRARRALRRRSSR